MRHKIKFEYVGDENVKCVSIAGTFNGWDHTKNYFTKGENNIFNITIDISKGRHLYKLIINNEDWITDPSNPSISEDGQNNSSITINEKGEKLIRTIEISKENPGYMYENYEAIESPDWIKQAVIYQLHLRAFTGEGFSGLKEKLLYLKELGINTIWIMPFNKVGKEKRIGKYGDPYAVYDYYSIDNKFGTEHDLINLIEEAHKLEMRVIMDWVINRASIDNVLTTTNPEFFTRDKDGRIYYEVPGREYFAGLNFENNEMRKYIIKALKYWIKEFNFDGVRLDDSDITPHDFLKEIRISLKEVRDDIVIISQAYDEYHHVESCDLTYDGGLRQLIHDVGLGNLTQKDFIKIYESFKFSFPKKSIRMKWLEEKEQIRAAKYFKGRLVFSAVSMLMTLEGVPLIMMGQEFNEKHYNNWTSLFDDFKLHWDEFDDEMYKHFKTLINIRNSNKALCEGDIIFIKNSHEKVISYIRKIKEEKLLIITNLSMNDVEVKLSNEYIKEAKLGAYITQIYNLSNGNNKMIFNK